MVSSINASRLPFRRQIIEYVLDSERELLPDVFPFIDSIAQSNQWKVLHAFQEEGIAPRHFAPTTGYGYDDTGRDALDRVFAQTFGMEDAIVRPQIVNGTHAIYLALLGLLQPGDTILSLTGAPYDTLKKAIGIGFGNISTPSLQDYGITYRQIDLTERGEIDFAAMEAALQDTSIRVLYAQRSRGYAWREALSIAQMQAAFSRARSLRKDIQILVDNCYGEFTECEEPGAAGADILAGSLIKNPGGGLAPTGGYIAGSEALIARIGERLTVPGLGREVGSYAASYQPFYQGLFLAPHVTAQSLKSAALFARIFERVGMTTLPHSSSKRSDIIQAVRFHDAKSLISFVQSIQRAAPVDSFAIPQPWDMPGYADQVIMAAGTFTQGASIELSADAPIREPYIAYLQGALTYEHGKLAAMLALDALEAAGEVTL